MALVTPSPQSSQGEKPSDLEGIFAVQLDVMGKLLDAERRKLALLQSEVSAAQCDDGRHTGAAQSSAGRTIQGGAFSRQRGALERLQLQHDRLQQEYSAAAAGAFRRSTAKSRSQPHIGVKQTTKARPSLFGALVERDEQSPLSKDAESSDTGDSGPAGGKPVRSRKSVKDGNLAAQFVEVAHRTNRLSVVLAHSSAMVYAEGRLISGTLDALIEHLVPTEKHYPDRTYVFAFLLCSRLYLAPHVLMERVAKRFRLDTGLSSHNRRSSSAVGASVGVQEVEVRPGVFATAQNMIQFLSEWSEAFAYDFRDERMMRHLKEITQSCAWLSPEMRRTVGQVTSVLIRRLATLDKYEEMLGRAELVKQERRSSESSAPANIMELCPDPEVLAQQLTHIELERLTHIGAEEFIETFVQEAGSHEVKRTNNLEVYVEWFNRLSYLVATEVCLSTRHEKKRHRAKTIEYFAEVARACCALNNFNSLMAVVAGLNFTSVTRLKKTWSKIHEGKTELVDLFANPSSNFQAYRQSLVDALSSGQVQDENFCVIPFFSLLVKDIYMLNESVPTKTVNGHINFDKCWQLAKLVTQFMSWKQVACDFERSRPILNYLMTTPVASDDELWRTSFELESPESTYEKERYKKLKTTSLKRADKK